MFDRAVCEYSLALVPLCLLDSNRVLCNVFVCASSRMYRQGQFRKSIKKSRGKDSTHFTGESRVHSDSEAVHKERQEDVHTRALTWLICARPRASQPAASRCV